ncbi:hypothetical protein AT15_08950 [Kosmotoga arenicorallina S304]|uniref:CBM20 domain-containing protein n=1 Tax=Kosmotoga arenicorallina S304 TaxID=1453497 RepID=A0A176K248_9BACT|nr:alpha/beta hydrolase-fold protein [Kosmotoga arenicorallina]OAA31093.1 hypothetical protein AT15_08950 [Kosmotoga arenicorallina S304]
MRKFIPLLLLLVFMVSGCSLLKNQSINSVPKNSNGSVDVSTNGKVRITFVVSVPGYTPEDADIYIGASFNGWNPGDPATKMNKVADNEYELTLEFDAGEHIEFKFTRGNWETVEKGEKGEEISNRTMEIKESGVFKFEVKHWRDFVEKGLVEVNLPHTLTGDFESFELFSPELNNKRNIIVYLPPSYKNDLQKRYPVLYMHDGQNLFDAVTSFVGEWEADETAEKLIKSGEIKEIIIVGIYNKGDQRLTEYSPWPFSSDGYTSEGKGDLYVDFIINSLKPYIDGHFRTLPDRESTAIAGSSMGGLISLYAAFKKPEIFGMVGAMSSSFWVSNGKIFDFVENAGVRNLRIYIDMGTGEGAQALKDTIKMVSLLKSIGYTDDTLLYVEDKGALHNEQFWAKRFPEMLKFFFGK